MNRNLICQKSEKYGDKYKACPHCLESPDMRDCRKERRRWLTVKTDDLTSYLLQVYILSKAGYKVKDQEKEVATYIYNLARFLNKDTFLKKEFIGFIKPPPAEGSVIWSLTLPPVQVETRNFEVISFSVIEYETNNRFYANLYLGTPLDMIKTDNALLGCIRNTQTWREFYRQGDELSRYKFSVPLAKIEHYNLKASFELTTDQIFHKINFVLCNLDYDFYENIISKPV